MKFCEIFLLLLGVSFVNSSITDYFKNAFSYFQNDNEENKSNDLVNFEKKVPYELSLIDEKFIADAIKLTGIGASELDKCQHRVSRKQISS